MNDLRFEKRLGVLRPAAPSSTLTQALEREFHANAPLDPVFADSQIPALEQALHRLSPAAASAKMQDLIALELGEDAAFEQTLRRLAAASVSKQTGHAIAAQMELRVLNTDQTANARPAQTSTSGAGLSPRPSPGKRWMALAAALAVSFVGFGLLRREMPLRTAGEDEARAPGELAEGGSKDGRVPGYQRDDDPHQTSASGRSVPGLQKGSSVDPRFASAIGAQGPHPSGFGEFSAEKGRRGEIARRNGSTALDPEPESSADTDAPSGRFLEARKLAVTSRTPGGPEGATTGAISSRTLLGSGTGALAAGTRVGVGAPSLEPNILETLASGRVSEVLPGEVLQLIREAATPRNTLALNRQESAGAGVSALQTPVSSFTASPPAVGAEVAARGASVLDAGPPAPGASVSETFPRALSAPGPGLITTASGGVPFLSEERSVVLNAAGRGVDASAPITSPERGPGGGSGISAEAEQIVYESTDGTVTFRMVRSGYGTVGRVSDAGGRVITEGLVISREDVARIAQRAILIQQLEGTVPASKGD